MKAKFISSEGESLLAKIEVKGKTLHVMDEFESESLEFGAEIEIELMDSNTKYLTWDELSRSNSNNVSELVHTKNWSYFAYGKIISIDPVLCDCEGAEIEAPIESSDYTLIGKYIGFEINVLTAFDIYEYVLTDLDLALDKYYDKEYEDAKELLTPLAQRDDEAAQLYLGRLFYYGKGIDQNHEKAAQWLEKSANNGNYTAQCFVGALYRDGKGVKQSYSRARMWFQSASVLGSRRAKSSLGWVYFKGLGVPKNYGKALSYLEEATDCADSYGTGLLGYFYEHGLVVKQDFKKAAELYASAKNLGDNHSYYNLGLAYYHGRGVIKNRKEALELIKHAADKGDKDAIRFMAEDEKK
jgi:TPR repeat protein